MIAAWNVRNTSWNVNIMNTRVLIIDRKPFDRVLELDVARNVCYSPFLPAASYVCSCTGCDREFVCKKNRVDLSADHDCTQVKFRTFIPSSVGNAPKNRRWDFKMNESYVFRAMIRAVHTLQTELTRQLHWFSLIRLVLASQHFCMQKAYADLRFHIDDACSDPCPRSIGPRWMIGVVPFGFVKNAAMVVGSKDSDSVEWSIHPWRKGRTERDSQSHDAVFRSESSIRLYLGSISSYLIHPMTIALFHVSNRNLTTHGPTRAMCSLGIESNPRSCSERDASRSMLRRSSVSNPSGTRMRDHRLFSVSKERLFH